MVESKRNILIVVEGAKTDLRLMKHLLNVYGIDQRHSIVSYNTNIYTLYGEMFADGTPDSIDLLSLLKEREPDSEKKRIFDKRYSDILLVFDLDPQDPQFSEDKIMEMASYFVESSDMGKLYINYPMVEAFYHMSGIPDPQFNERIVAIQELISGTYKQRVNAENRNHDYTKFAVDRNECNIVIRQNLDKAWRMLKTQPRIKYPPHMKDILNRQLSLMQEKKTLQVLCTCAFYIADYNPALLDS